MQRSQERTFDFIPEANGRDMIVIEHIREYCVGGLFFKAYSRYIVVHKI